MGNGVVFRKARESLTEDDFYEVKELKDEKRKREIKEELGLKDELMTYEEAEDLAGYLEVDVKNVYISRAGFFDIYSYFNKDLGLLVSLFDGKLESVKKLRVKEIIIHQERRLRNDLKNRNYDSYFFMVDSKIKLMMLNKIFEIIPDEQKYQAFKDIYSSTDYGFHMINEDIFYDIRDSLSESDILEIKSLADENGYVAIYRGMTRESTDIKDAFSWTTDISTALFFATRFSAGEYSVYKGRIDYEDIVAFIDSRDEKEVVVFYDDVEFIEKVELTTLEKLLFAYDYLEEYREEVANIVPELFHSPEGIHGASHAERVLFLVMAISYFENISDNDRKMLMKAAKYHDIGRINDDICYNHGALSIEKMKELKIIEEGNLEKDEVLRYIIENHCIDDKEAYENVSNYKIEKKEIAMYLLNIFKDADNLDRVRIKDLDVNYLRTESAKELVGVAYRLANIKNLESLRLSI